ncbi:MAG: alpha-L-fucosidase [Sedimentisphaerales bacterium]|nr:alpha-L-fucosidase [Sedimentisphaerales bacterium]
MNNKCLMSCSVWIVLSLICSFRIVSAASQVDPAALKHWQDLRLGMFIHWGPVSLTGHEIGWSRGQQTSMEEYDRLYKRFNPVQFNADEWVRVAKTMGAKYIVLTTKHHDGFCLWDTKQTDFNIMNSPFGRDVLKELAIACKKQDIELGTYHSTCDWHHPDFPLTSPGGKVRRTEYNLERYTEYIKAQTAELLKNYGPLITLWYDVPQEFDARRGQTLIDLCRSLQPSIVVNNRTGAPGDFSTPEQHVGDFNRERPWETCMTLCQQWAWKPNDKMKSLKECVQTLLYTVGGDGNLLFNVGPMPDGRIEPRQVERLTEMGQWIRNYSDAIYGTRGGPFKPGKWGASTCKGNTVFLFIMKWPQESSFQMPALPVRVIRSVIRTGGTMTLRQTSDAFEIEVPVENRDPIATVVELTLDRPAFSIQPISLVYPSQSASFGKKGEASNVFQKNKSYGPDKALDDDSDTRWATDEGITSAWFQVDLGEEKNIHRVLIDERQWNRIKRFELQAQCKEKWMTIYSGTTIGQDKVIAFEPVKARFFRLNILESVNGPTLWEVQLYEVGKGPK